MQILQYAVKRYQMQAENTVIKLSDGTYNAQDIYLEFTNLIY
ncbi:hypothetical protein [Emticicia soli]|uniref:Uncharacterized protein n=1 Tax=Emticicia soli TaxID=2027878 RepID=A0ABW5J780_9BACT